MTDQPTELAVEVAKRTIEKSSEVQRDDLLTEFCIHCWPSLQAQKQ